MSFDFREQKNRHLEGQSRRHFPIDIFISHNQDDSSRAFAEELIKKGLTVWHDQYFDLTDGKVENVVSDSSKKARFVVLCICDGFRDSQWCRAEYLPALEAEQTIGTTRLLIALLNEDAIVPHHLSACRQFLIYKDGINPLVKFIKEENLVTSHRLDFQVQSPQSSKIDQLTKRFNYLLRIITKTFATSKEDYVVNLILALNKGDDQLNNELNLMNFRIFLYDSSTGDLPKIKVNELLAPALLLLARREYILASNSDARANALYIALWVGLTYPSITARRTNILLLCQESDEQILEFAKHLIECVQLTRRLSVENLTGERNLRIIVEILNNKLVNINNTERLKRYLQDKSVLQKLSFLEETHLWSRHLAHICRSRTEHSVPLFNASKTELALRELHRILFEGIGYHNIPRQFGDEEKEIFSCCC